MMQETVQNGACRGTQIVDYQRLSYSTKVTERVFQSANEVLSALLPKSLQYNPCVSSSK